MQVASSEQRHSVRSRSADGADPSDNPLQTIYRGMRSELHRHSGSLGGHVYLDINAVVRDVLGATPAEDLSDYRRRARLLHATAQTIRRVLVEQACACRDTRYPAQEANTAGPARISNRESGRTTDKAKTSKKESEDPASRSPESPADATHESRETSSSAAGRIHFDTPTVASLIELDEALTRLGRSRPRLADVAQCMIFGRMSCSEVAAALDVTPDSVKRDWLLSQVWIHRWRTDPDKEPPTDGGP